jgi:hypothetical protein
LAGATGARAQGRGERTVNEKKKDSIQSRILDRRRFLRTGTALAASSAGGFAQHRSNQGLDYAPDGDPRFVDRRWAGGGPYVGIGQMSHHGSHRILPGRPLAIGQTRQLAFMDDLMDDWWDCRRTVHQPVKHPANPLLKVAKPWEGYGPMGGTILKDPATGRFRLWSFIEYFGTKRPSYGIYYESSDGLHWERPDLGLVDWDGNTANNLFYGGQGYGMGAISVILSPADRAARGRFAMMYGRNRIGTKLTEPHTMEQRIAYSDDGLRWRDQPENPAFRARSDAWNNLFFAPERGVFVNIRRPGVHANEIRRITYSESQDLVAWTQPVTVLKPDELDPPMFYGMPVVRYQGVYFGFLEMFYAYYRFDRTKGKIVGDRKLPKSHEIDLQLAWSRNCLDWSRHPERPIFLPTGPIGSYDWGMVFAMYGIEDRGDEIWIYYRGDQGLHSSATPPKYGNLCLATLRKDGFVSLDASDDGFALTRPLECPGGRLHVNARTAPDGFVKVAVRQGDAGDDGDWLDDYGYDRVVPMRGDALDHTVVWRNGPAFDSRKGQPIRLHFWLNKAELYSFRFGP